MYYVSNNKGGFMFDALHAFIVFVTALTLAGAVLAIATGVSRERN